MFEFVGCMVDQLAVMEDDGDLSSFEMENFSQCLEHCASLSDCFVWTFYSGTCWLKGKDTVLYPANRVSGVKPCNNTGNKNLTDYVMLLLYN